MNSPLLGSQADSEHLSDVALFEWARFRELKLATGTGATVSTHLAKCPECREKLEGVVRLEQGMHPYGAPYDETASQSLLGRVIVVTAALGLLVGAAALIF